MLRILKPSILFAVFAFFYLCACSDNDNFIPKEQVVLNTSQEVSQFNSFGPDPLCPGPKDIPCQSGDQGNLKALFGDPVDESTTGVIEEYLNCPFSQPTTADPCNDCPNRVVFFEAVELDLPYDLCLNTPFCNKEGVIPAATQSEIMAAIKSYVRDNAPMCGERRMTAVNYDITYSVLLPIAIGSPPCFGLYMEVTYTDYCPNFIFFQ